MRHETPSGVFFVTQRGGKFSINTR